MYMYTVGHSRIVSTGTYIPEQRITSREIMEQIESQQRFRIPRDWLERTTGIREKRVAPEHMFPSDMASHAATEAMEIAGVAASDIDVIIYAGMDRDYVIEPATAHAVQNKINASRAVAFDVTNACHGFMNGIHLMDALIATGQARRGLVVTGEQGSRHTRKTIEAMQQTTDREKFAKWVGGLTLGDAGAAMIMGPKLEPDTGFMGFMLQSQGQHATLCTCGRRNEDPLLLEIDMPAIVEHGIAMLGEMYEALMLKLGWRPQEIARFLHHQVGLKVFKRHAAYAKVSLDIMPRTVPEYGNLITANIPVSIHDLYRNQTVACGEKVFLSGAGSGISISQAGLIWDAA